MIKFVFHGGATRKPLEGNKRFFAEMVRGLREPIKILNVYFAREESRWNEAMEDDKQNFRNAAPNIKMEFSLANPESFVTQVKDVGVVYVRGGSTPLLKKAFEPFSQFLTLLDGKVYGGSSAGADVLAKYYCSRESDEILEGLGLLPIKVFPHYDESEREKLEKLKAWKEDLPTYTIAEGEYFIYKNRF
ncbi:MAG: Type 1 glutamine amidotransferase-like domain-containing protein [Minisyncoccia bacterium]|jgi:peptidase E